MNRIAEIIRAVFAALASIPGKLVRGVKTATRWVGGRAVSVLEDTWEWTRETAVPAVAHGAWEGLKASPGVALALTAGSLRIAGRAAHDVALAPFKFTGKALNALMPGRGGGGGVQAEQAAADQAAQGEELRQAQAARVQELKETLAAFRRSVAARAAGRDLADQDLSRLPQPLVDLVDKLSTDECDVLSQQPVGVLQAYTNGQGAVPGVRSPSAVANGATPPPGQRTMTPEAIAAEIRVTARSELRSAIRRSRRSALMSNDNELAA